MAFLLEYLQRFIKQHELDCARIALAYSGGIDSETLLHALVQMQTIFPKLQLRAIHINHDLLSAASEWQQHCQQQCQQLQVPYQAITADIKLTKGESIEAQARHARYQIFKQQLQCGEYLCLAHHQDDQAETLLLQLFRGAGVKGLAAMADINTWDAGFIIRPLLNITRQQIQAYAKEQQLSWCDDPSNASMKFDRNYLRHQIMPLLEARWPNVGKTISRSAAHCAEADSMLEEVADSDLAKVSIDGELSITKLQQLNLERQKNVLRAWLLKQDLPLPSEQVLLQLINNVVMAKADANPKLHYHQTTLRRFQDRLLIETEQPAMANDWHASWDFQQPLLLPDKCGELKVESTMGQGLSARIKAVEVRFRRGGERCVLPGRTHSQSLKKLLQFWQVPPWMRDQIPLLYVDDQLAVIVGFAVCDEFIAGNDEMGWLIKLSR